MELHFYPGQNLLTVRNKTALIGRFEAWGGPAAIVLHGSDMREEPTWPGHYVIAHAESYRTPTWPWAKIKWGTRLRDLGEGKGVLYQLPSGAWGDVEKDHGIPRKAILAQSVALYQAKVVPKTWVFNDFGPIAIRWFKDSNGNRVLDKAERLSGQMFHTTPKDEAAQARGLPVRLQHSHGCIHLKPADRDRLFAIGAFTPKTNFIVHPYHARF